MNKAGQQGIEGHAFLDKNYNGFYDGNDIPLENLKIILDNKKTYYTDEDGFYQIAKAKKGNNTLSIDKESVDLPTEKLEYQDQYILNLTGHQTMTINMPFSYKKANLMILAYLDSNSNGVIDSDDKPHSPGRPILIMPNGTKKNIYTSIYGGGLFKGLEHAEYKVILDPLNLPDTIEFLSPVEQTITISEDINHEIKFLFKNIRIVRGRAMMDDPNIKLPRNLIITLGNASSKVDKDGYYTLEGMADGLHELQLKNISSKYCIKRNINPKINVSGSVMINVNIPIIDCNLIPAHLLNQNSPVTPEKNPESVKSQEP